MNISVREIRSQLTRRADPERAKNLQRFFKTRPGEYGEGDRFLGIRVPELRKISRDCTDLRIEEIAELLRSPVHEERLLSLFLLVRAYQKGEDRARRKIFDLYLKEIRHVNNWDLVDCSAPCIVGGHLASRDRRPLYRMAKSRSLWKRRIAVLATFHFIRGDDFSDALAIADVLLQDPEDLIQKAVGWMLREVGNRAPQIEEGFIRQRHMRMPRTMLRYAIERFPVQKRQMYLLRKREGP